MCRCCSAGCGRAVGVTFTFVAFLACGLAFIAPFWLLLGDGTTYGLWGACPQKLDINNITTTFDGCTWFFQDDWAWEKALEDWQYACQFFTGLGVVFMFLAIFTGSGAACCCRSDRLAYFTGVTLVFSAILYAVGIGVWGYFIHDTTGAMPFVHDGGSDPDWAFYLGIGGTVVSFLAGFFFFCNKDRSEDYEKA